MRDNGTSVDQMYTAIAQRTSETLTLAPEGSVEHHQSGLELASKVPQLNLYRKREWGSLNSTRSNSRLTAKVPVF